VKNIYKKVSFSSTQIPCRRRIENESSGVKQATLISNTCCVVAVLIIWILLLDSNIYLGTWGLSKKSLYCQSERSQRLINSIKTICLDSARHDILYKINLFGQPLVPNDRNVHEVN